jgi:elongation factor Ts
MTINKLELIKQLRETTQAPMNAVKRALEETDYQMEAATDLIKSRGLQQTKNTETRVATEGVVRARIHHANGNTPMGVMFELTSNTDFQARTPEFLSFADAIEQQLLSSAVRDFATAQPINEQLEVQRQELVAKTKENIQVRRFFVEEVSGDNRMIWRYVHNNDKIGVLASFEAPTADTLHSESFLEFADNVCMQIAAMAPIAVSRDKLAPELIERQNGIFQTQLKELGKPEASWPKITEGKLNKWYSEACLLEQESVITAKKTIATLADELSTTLCGEAGRVRVLSFVRCVVGEGIVKEETDLAVEVAKTLEGSV